TPDPGDDRGGVAADASPQLVPFAVLPELRPLLRRHRQPKGGLVLLDFLGAVQEVEVADVDATAEALPVDTHQVALPGVVDHGLARLALAGAAQEQAAVRAEVVAHLQDDLEILVGLVSDEQPTVTGAVLAAHDGAVLDHPAAAALVAAGAAVARLGANMP